MKQLSISVVIPAYGRASLGRTLESVRAAGYLPGDEVVAVFDGDIACAREYCEMQAERLGMAIRCIMAPKAGGWGSPSRNTGMGHAGGDILCFIDDDDHYLPGAFGHIRAAHRAHICSMILFRVKWNNTAIWRTRDIVSGNLGTCCITIDRRLSPVARWEGKRYNVDYMYAHAQQAAGSAVEWDENIIAEIPAQQRGAAPAPDELCMELKKEII